MIYLQTSQSTSLQAISFPLLPEGPIKRVNTKNVSQRLVRHLAYIYTHWRHTHIMYRYEAYSTVILSLHTWHYAKQSYWQLLSTILKENTLPHLWIHIYQKHHNDLSLVLAESITSPGCTHLVIDPTHIKVCKTLTSNAKFHNHNRWPQYKSIAQPSNLRHTIYICHLTFIISTSSIH